MKKWILILCLSLSYSFVIAQRGGGKFELLQTAKIGFLTKELELTPSEAEKFWPIYNKFEAEKKAARKRQMAQNIIAGANFDSYSDKQVEDLIEENLKFRQSEIEIERKAIMEYKKILPIKKVARLLIAERKFQKEVLKTLRNKKLEGEED
jgi:hypothetical protein